MHTTPATLLEQLRRSPDDSAWRKLVHLYTPLLFSWARRAGIDDHDAADLVQEVFVILLEALPTFHYDRNGHFRGWLRSVTLNKWRDKKRREAIVRHIPLENAQSIEAPDDAILYWDRDYADELASHALRLMKADFSPTTWKACWEYVAQDRSAVEVARELGITENAVYLAKCHVMRRLRRELTGLIE